jgi:hypothetical protein
LIVTEPHQCSFEPKQELSFFSLHSIGIKLFVQLHEIVGIHGDPIQRLRVSALCTPQQVAYGEQGAMSVQYSITQRLTGVHSATCFQGKSHSTRKNSHPRIGQTFGDLHQTPAKC